MTDAQFHQEGGNKESRDGSTQRQRGSHVRTRATVAVVAAGSGEASLNGVGGGRGGRRGGDGGGGVGTLGAGGTAGVVDPAVLRALIVGKTASGNTVDLELCALVVGHGERVLANHQVSIP
ncbi:uncharacterized protein PgNI_00302 [Pyricularia grisea]|uniref:Uncharacterized protein n=1 Tax=Pyricularia grisea TaxID=148305 RepID=A0A6P8BFB8_PYRGI